MTDGVQSSVRSVRWLHAAACVIVVIAGLRAGASVLIPILFAAMSALIFTRPALVLQRWGLPRPVAMLAVVVVAVGVLVGLSGIVGGAVSAFSDNLPLYEVQIEEKLEGALDWLESIGLKTVDQSLVDRLDTEKLLQLVAATTEGVLSLFSDIVLILLIMVFMLLEADRLPQKLRRALGRPDADLAQYSRGADQVFDYLSIKAGLSLVTGILIAVFLTLLGVNHAVLWGLVAFLFNFIPNIGSVIAAVPPVLLAFVQYGGGKAVAVGVGFVAVNMVIGNVVEPRMMGRKLGLSPLVVLLSLIFWSWVWGPVGMILSLPMTMVVKILLENGDDTRYLAVLLGPVDALPEDGSPG